MSFSTDLETHTASIPILASNEAQYTQALEKSGSLPTPIALIGEAADPALVEAQDTLGRAFTYGIEQELSDIKPKSRKFVSDSISVRMGTREGQNAAAYMNRLYPDPQFDRAPDHSQEELEAIHSRVLQGTEGDMRHIEAFRAMHGMSSVEYGNLTIFGEQRRAFEEPMRRAVSELVSREVQFDEPYGNMSLRFISFDRNLDKEKHQHLGALRFDIKRNLGTLEGDDETGDTVVKRRSTLILNTSPSSGFTTKRQVNGLIEAYQDGGPRAVHDHPAFQGLVSRAIETSYDAPFVLARNETIYGYNKDLEDRIRIQKEAASTDTAPTPHVH